MFGEFLPETTIFYLTADESGCWEWGAFERVWVRRDCQPAEDHPAGSSTRELGREVQSKLISCGTYCHMLSHEINLFLDLTSNMWFSKELNKKI